MQATQLQHARLRCGGVATRIERKPIRLAHTLRVGVVPVVAAVHGRRVSPLARAPLKLRASLTSHPGEEASGLGSSGSNHGSSSGSGNSGSSHGLIGPFMSVPNTVMAKGGTGDMGSGSALGAVLERSRIEIVMPTPPQQAPRLDDGGDGGGLGKNNHNGGGGGDGGGDDDDDFFGEEGDGDGEGGGGGGGGPGVALFRTSIPELFDRAALGAVLQEWYKTIADLPLFIRRSVEMGLFSSAQLVRFLAMDVRPNAARAVSRALPTAWAREFVGRLMADPGFVQKLVIEQTLAFTASMLHEWRVRGDAFKRELDLAVINSVGLAASVAAAVWVTAPSRAAGAVHAFPWQKMLANLPHCVFDASGPLRAYSPAARVGGFFASMAQLSAVGAAAGAATAGASALAVAARRRADPTFEPSAPVPEPGRASAGLGAFFALNANLRYQLLGGLDRYLFGHAAALWGYLGLTAAARVAATAAGELTRPWWQGLATETHPDHLVAPTRRPRVRKVVKRRVVKKQPAAAEAEAAAAAAASQQQQQQASPDAALAAALAAAGATAGAHLQQQQEQEPASGSGVASHALAPAASDDDASAGPEDEAAAAGLVSAVEARLGEAPAVMGSPERLAGLARADSFSATAMGGALRDAVGSEALA